MYATKHYAYSFHRFFLVVPFSCSSCRLRRSLQYTSPHSDIYTPINVAEMIHFAYHTCYKQGRGEQLLLSVVYRSAAEYIRETRESGQCIAQKINRPPLKKHKKRGERIWLLEVKIFKGLRSQCYKKCIKIKYA